MSRGNVIISITFSFSITQTDEKERDTHGFPSIILGRGVARRHGWRWTIGCYPSLKTIPIASVTLTRIFKVCFLSTINSFLPEDVGMRKAIHQLDFVKHVLPVGSQQIHLEHHHLVRGSVSNLFQIIQPVTKENERKTKQEEKHLLGIDTTHNTDAVSSLDNNNNSTHPVVKGLPFLHSDVHLHPTCRFIGLRSNSKKYKEKNLRCSNRLQSSYTHDWVWMTWKTRDRERERGVWTRQNGNKNFRENGQHPIAGRDKFCVKKSIIKPGNNIQYSLSLARNVQSIRVMLRPFTKLVRCSFGTASMVALSFEFLFFSSSPSSRLSCCSLSVSRSFHQLSINHWSEWVQEKKQETEEDALEGNGSENTQANTTVCKESVS